MDQKKHLINKDYLLQKFPGKGAWTYAEIPEIPQNSKNPFGWVQVKGAIDDYPLRQFKLMPMGNGRLFLPVRASIRKKIKKEAGDHVHLILDLDHSELEIPTEIMECFKNEPKSIYESFSSFSDGEKKAYLDWIYLAKTDATKVKRIAQMMERLQYNLKLRDRIK